jgi:hypothetical protein
LKVAWVAPTGISSLASSSNARVSEARSSGSTSSSRPAGPRASTVVLALALVEILFSKNGGLIIQKLAHLVFVEVIGWIVTIMATVARLSLDDTGTANENDRDNLIWHARVAPIHVLSRHLLSLLGAPGPVVAQRFRMGQ